MTIRYPDPESERNQNLRTSNLELRHLWEAEKARAASYALLVGEYRAVLESMLRPPDCGGPRFHDIAAILAADPEARADDAPDLP